MRPIAERLNKQANALNIMAQSVRNIDQRLGFLEAKLEQQLATTKSGNTTRNLIAGMVAVKMLFEGLNIGTLESLLKLMGG